MPELKFGGDYFLYDTKFWNVDVFLDELIGVGDRFLNNTTGNAINVYISNVENIRNYCIKYTTAAKISALFASKLKKAGYDFLSGALVSGSVLQLESLVEVGAGSFTNNIGLSVTVYTNKRFAQTSAEYKAFKALNTVTEILIDNDVIEQVTTSAVLTSTSTTGAALDCNGATQAQLTLTLGTATTAPALQVQGSDDGTNWYNLGVSLTGVASSTVTIQLDNILPKNLRWKVSTAGASIGAGYKIILRCK